MLETTLQQVIEKVDSIKPNAYDEETKTGWINKVEGIIQKEILHKKDEDMIVYDWGEDADTELLVKHPYSDIYEFYLFAMIDYMNGDISFYQNSMTMFNNAFEDYSTWYKREYGKDTGLQITNIW